MEINYVLGISSLDTDSERVCGVEGECDQPPRAGRHRLAQHSRVDLELQQTRITCIKSGDNNIGMTIERNVLITPI